MHYAENEFATSEKEIAYAALCRLSFYLVSNWFLDRFSFLQCSFR